MRSFITFLLTIALSVTTAMGREMPFSESAKGLLDLKSLSSADITRIDAFVARMDSRQETFRKTRSFIQYLNDQTHQEIFLSYEQLTSLEDLVVSGKYNCLTGSAFFALLLERYHIPYEVIETNYHMFILIVDDGNQYLLDSTDPIRGFETNAASVRRRLSEYKSKNQESKINTVAFQFDLFNCVEISQLEGLLAYNNSVASYNQQDFKTAVNYLYKASMHYNSPRILEMAVLIESYLRGMPDSAVYIMKIDRIKQKAQSPELLARN